jgi:hypothetical protein
VEQSRSALQEITERERERRQLLEAEVEQIRELKRKKAEDIERLRQIKDDVSDPSFPLPTSKC